MAGSSRIHAIETGDGKPLVLLHGSGPTALQFLPLLERLPGVRAIAVDRAGFGLSDPIEPPSEDYREAAVDSVNVILDGLGLTETALLGNSAGGTCALWYALAHPDRVTRLVGPMRDHKAAAAASTIATMSGLERTALAPGTAVRVLLAKPSGAADGGGSGCGGARTARLHELERLGRDGFRTLR